MIEHGTCNQGCGATVPVEVPDDWDERWQEKMRRVGETCASCKAQKRAEDDDRRRRQSLHVREARIATSGLPRALQAIRWEQLDVDDANRKAIAAAKRWAAAETKGTVLTGPIGVGKTTIAAAAAYEYLHRGQLRWTSMPRLFQLLGAGRNDRNRQTAVDLTQGRGALVLDDLDKSRPTEYGAEVVFGVIDHRYAEGWPLLITTNLDYAQLAMKFPEPFGEAIASRLVEYCGEAYMVGGDDRRLPPAAAPLPGTEEVA